MMRFNKVVLLYVVKHNKYDLTITFKPLGMETNRVIRMYIQKDSVNMFMEDEDSLYDDTIYLTDEEELLVLREYAINSLDMLV